MRNTFKNFVKSNKGSSIVTVIIIMLVIGFLGSSLLFAAYSGTLVKNSVEKGVQSFYDAETLMDAMVVSMNGVVEKVAQEAFELTMMDYSKISQLPDPEATFESEFNKHFYECLDKTEIPAIDGDGKRDFMDIVKEADDFKRFKFKLSAVESNMALVYGFDNIDQYRSYCDTYFTGWDKDMKKDVIYETPWYDLYEGKDTLIFKNLTVDYVNPSTGYSSKIISDLVIKPPKIDFSKMSYTVTSVPEYSLVVGGEFSPASGNISVTGNAYMGDISGFPATNLNFDSGMVVCKNKLIVPNSSTVALGQNTNMWVNDIEVNGNLTTDGFVKVKDDMDLLDGANVTMKGNYHGYGAGTTKEFVNESSAILINGINTKLNMSGLSDLTLAGQGFIKSGVLTGESVSVQGSQKAYLIPVEYLIPDDSNKKITNPMQISTNNPVSVKIDVQAPIFEVDGVTKDYANYGIGENDVITILVPINKNESIQYFFMDFKATSQASKYFRDFFSSNSELMKNYINMYLTDFTAVNAANMMTRGVGLSKSGEDYILTDITGGGVFSNYSAMKKEFENLTRSLSVIDIDYTKNPDNSTGASDKIDAKNYEVYNHLVNEKEIEEMNISGVREFKDINDNVVALLVGKTYTFDSTIYPDVKVILTVPKKCSTLSINGDFEGLIVTDGDLKANGNISSNSEAVISAFTAGYPDSENPEDVFASCFDIGLIPSTSSAGDERMWNLDEMFTFENWREE